jgi:hypothetical protein
VSLYSSATPECLFGWLQTCAMATVITRSPSWFPARPELGPSGCHHY